MRGQTHDCTIADLQWLYVFKNLGCHFARHEQALPREVGMVDIPGQVDCRCGGCGVRRQTGKTKQERFARDFVQGKCFLDNFLHIA